MTQRKILVALACVALSSAAIANETIDYSLSVKSWNAAVDVDLNGVGSGSSQAGNSSIIGLTAKKGDYFASISTLLSSSYVFNSGTNNLSTVERGDLDLGLGYRVNQNISVIAGYKNLVMKDHSLANYEETHGGVYVGLAAFKLINDTSFMYGNVWIAPKMSSSGTSTVDKLDDFKAQNYEFGVGHALTNSTQITLGYRNQQMKTYNSTQSRSETYTMKGLIAGLNVNF
jgi:hypothetical protein